VVETVKGRHMDSGQRPSRRRGGTGEDITIGEVAGP